MTSEPSGCSMCISRSIGACREAVSASCWCETRCSCAAGPHSDTGEVSGRWTRLIIDVKRGHMLMKKRHEEEGTHVDEEET